MERIIRLLNSIGLTVACILWGQTSYLYLQLNTGNNHFLYCSVKSFQDRVTLMNSHEKEVYELLLRYDNVFIYFFGIFLLTYALLLFLRLSKKYIKPFSAHFIWLLATASVIYVICDQKENNIMYEIMQGRQVIAGCFLEIQITKWVASLFCIIACLLIDLFILKRYFVLFKIALSLALVFVTVYALAGTYRLKEIQSRYNNSVQTLK